MKVKQNISQNQRQLRNVQDVLRPAIVLALCLVIAFGAGYLVEIHQIF
jgi:hypothetical protein